MRVDLQETGSARWTLWLRAALCFAVAVVAILDIAWVISGRVTAEGLIFGIPGAVAFGAAGVTYARRAVGSTASRRTQANGAA